MRDAKGEQAMNLIDTTWGIDQETIYALEEHLVNKRNIQRKKLLYMVTHETHTAAKTGLVEAAILKRAVR